MAAHLAQLKNDGLIADGHDRKIVAGTEWKGQIDKHIDWAYIILLLVSADFLASPYCYDVEMKRAMARHESGEARVIPVILRPSCVRRPRGGMGVEGRHGEDRFCRLYSLLHIDFGMSLGLFERHVEALCPVTKLGG